MSINIELCSITDLGKVKRLCFKNYPSIEVDNDKIILHKGYIDDNSNVKLFGWISVELDDNAVTHEAVVSSKGHLKDRYLILDTDNLIVFSDKAEVLKMIDDIVIRARNGDEEAFNYLVALAKNYTAVDWIRAFETKISLFGIEP